MKLSLITCSRTNRLPEALRRNVENTIGCDYEWIVIDNSSHQYNIFQAYNNGIGQATGDIFCFMHDDLRYHTNNWGLIVEKTFRDNSKLALLGVAGAHLLVDAPAPMWEFQHISTVRIWSKKPICESPFDQHGILPDGGYWSGNTAFAEGKKNVPAANIDGLWMCGRRECFEQMQFDEQTFDGFHCYDADISMQALEKGWDVMVNTEILIEHFSDSILTPDYFRAADQWYGKWKDCLPIVRGVELDARMVETLKFYTLDARRYEEALIENRRLRNTHAYRLGKKLLKPISWLRRNK